MFEFDEKSFTERCSRGEATLDVAEDYVGRRHESSTDGEFARYLGMTEREYALWLRYPNALADIVTAHRRRVPLEAIANGKLRGRLANSE